MSNSEDRPVADLLSPLESLFVETHALNIVVREMIGEAACMLAAAEGKHPREYMERWLEMATDRAASARLVMDTPEQNERIYSRMVPAVAAYFAGNSFSATYADGPDEGKPVLGLTLEAVTLARAAVLLGKASTQLADAGDRSDAADIAEILRTELDKLGIDPEAMVAADQENDANG